MLCRQTFGVKKNTSVHTVGLACCAGQVRQLEQAEQLAVEQEDFESAANLSSELDSLR